LADAGQELVGGLRRKDKLVLRALARLAHRMEGAVEGVERGVRQPGLVEMQRVDVAVERVLDRLGVVENAVVSALREREDSRLDGGRVDTLQKRVGRDLALDRLERELALRDRADDAVVVARGRQE